MEKDVWFITGTSSGLGKALAEEVMKQGAYVFGSVRSRNQADQFNEVAKDCGQAILLDVTDVGAITDAAQTIIGQVGKLNVLVNNAGFGFAAAVEEASLDEIKEVFAANFYGALKTTQAFLPILRKQQYGHIIQISSHGGVKAMPGFGIYNASKFALEGFSEALAAEIAPFNIKLTIIEPGPFRTNFAGSAFRIAHRTIAEYESTAGTFKQRIKQVDGKQEGDPVKAAKAIINITKVENPPLRLPLGKVAIVNITSKIESLSSDLEAGRTIAESSVYNS